MNKYAIIVDSSADMTKEALANLDVNVVPFSVSFKGEMLRDDTNNPKIDMQEFYSQLRNGELSTTSQPNASDYISIMEPSLAEGKDIFCLTLSSALSGSNNSCSLAKNELSEKYPNSKIVIVDSLSATIGEWLLIELIVKKRSEGATIEEVEKYALEMRDNICLYFVVDDLKYLHRGGRLSAGQAMLGSIFTIKPVMSVNDEGKIIPIDKVKGMKKASDLLIKKINQKCIDPKNSKIMIAHSYNEDTSRYLLESVKNTFENENVSVSLIGPIIGCHLGPGSIVCVFLGSHRE